MSHPRGQQAGLNTLAVGQPLVSGGAPVWAEVSSGLNTLAVGQPLVGRARWGVVRHRSSSQYPHSWAASCWLLAHSQPHRVSGHVSIPSQLGSLLLGRDPQAQATGRPGLNTLTVGQPLVGRRFRLVQERPQGLNTLTVGQPLVGTATAVPTTATPSLNTLTVGQPLVGMQDM